MAGKITVQIDAKDAMEKLSRLEGESVGIVQKIVKSTGLFILSRIPPYPPPRPGQRYVRGQGKSQRLGQSYFIQVQIVGKSVLGNLATPVTYAPWVVSSEKTPYGGPQAWMHQGRWYTLQGVVESNAENIGNFMRIALYDELERRLK